QQQQQQQKARMQLCRGSSTAKGHSGPQKGPQEFLGGPLGLGPPGALVAAPAAAAAAAAEGGALQWAKLLPDGSGICGVYADGLVRFFATPESLSVTGRQAEQEGAAAAAATEAAAAPEAAAAAAAEVLSPWLEVAAGEAVWDLAFPPQLFAQEAADSCCCAISVLDHPIQVRRLVDGCAVCSLLFVDRGEELQQIFAVAFAGSKLLLAAAKSAFALFDLDRPPKPVQEWQLGTRRSKGSSVQKGVISKP
ncbi:hypothetical protein, conserved, partial [Eimeria tenella]